MIAIDGLRKRFGSREVLRGLDLVVRPGAVHLLVGANGAGKTTLLRCLAGLTEPDAGRVLLNGADLRTDRANALVQLAFLPQAPRFHPRLTTRQVARYYGRLRRRSDAEVDAELGNWDLAEHAAVITSHLSGGLRQRLALAVFALARAPVLVLDEPGLSLDPAWRERLAVFLTGQARADRTVLVATHLLGEWEGRADTCFWIREGVIGGELPPAGLRASFAAAEGRSAA